MIFFIAMLSSLWAHPDAQEELFLELIKQQGVYSEENFEDQIKVATDAIDDDLASMRDEYRVTSRESADELLKRFEDRLKTAQNPQDALMYGTLLIQRYPKPIFRTRIKC